MSVDSDTVDRTEVRRRTDYSKRKLRMIDHMEEVDAPRSAKELADGIGKHKTTVYGTLNDLHDEGLVNRIDGKGGKDPARWELDVEIVDKIQYESRYTTIAKGIERYYGIFIIVSWLLVMGGISGLLWAVLSIPYLVDIAVGFSAMGVAGMGVMFAIIRTEVKNASS